MSGKIAAFRAPLPLNCFCHARLPFRSRSSEGRSVLSLSTVVLSTGVSNFSAMAGRIDFILGVAGHYAISAAVKAMFECEIDNVVICSC